ncbi:MAG: hypothetical protein ACI3XZ_10295 [Butyricicoccus sp.]
MSANTKRDAVLQYKGHPLVRKDNVIYYGSMTDSHIIMMQILDTKKDNGLDVASRVSVQLQQTAPGLRTRDRIVKSTEKSSLWSAMDIASIWLGRALSSK